jgi:hypothetical protein
MKGKRSKAKLTEELVRVHISRELGSMGYSKNVSHRGRGQGPDIRVSDHGGHQYIVECKGERKNPSSAMDVDIYYGLGQLLSRYDGGHSVGKEYGLGFPLSFRVRLFGKLTKRILEVFPFHVFFVEPNGRVLHLTPRQVKAASKGRPLP